MVSRLLKVKGDESSPLVEPVGVGGDESARHRLVERHPPVPQKAPVGDLPSQRMPKAVLVHRLEPDSLDELSGTEPPQDRVDLLLRGAGGQGKHGHGEIPADDGGTLE